MMRVWLFLCGVGAIVGTVVNCANTPDVKVWHFIGLYFIALATVAVVVGMAFDFWLFLHLGRRR
jgi:hypothetical protein